MAPKLTEDEIDDLIYFARAGEDDDLTETLKELAEREKVTTAEILVAAKDESNKSTSLHMATGNGHLETVRKIVACFDNRPKEEKQAFLDDVNEHGNTGLHWAALGGHLEVVKLLLEQGASPALANEANYIPLDLANLNEKAEVAKYFFTFAGSLEDKNQEEGLSGAVESVEIEVEDEADADAGKKADQSATSSS